MVRTGASRGRRPKPEQERKRANLTFRVREQLRDALRQRAAREGRSISEEIEHRLERSLHEEELFGDGVHLRLVVQNVGRVLRELELLAGRRAFGPDGDPWLHQQAWDALSRWFAATKPAGKAETPAKLSDAYKPRPPDALIKALGDLTMTAEFYDIRDWALRRAIEHAEPASEFLWRRGRQRSKKGDNQ